jgi:serine/threonine protein phosphatase PrpC
MLSIDVGSASHTGLIRERNEDSAITAGGVFAVADGMGGHAAGDMASRLAVASLMRLSANPDLQSQDIIAAVAQANADILDAVAQSSDRFGMGTTLTGVSLLDPAGEPRWVVFNVGDSRVYRFAGNQLTQLTVDHSEVGELLAAGRLTADEAKLYPRRNVVTRSLGTVPAPTPDVWVLEPVVGERFVICSDGLTLEVEESEIAEILRAEPEAQRAADRMVAQAVSAGGRDNVTVIVLAYGPPEEPERDQVTRPIEYPSALVEDE